MRRTFRPNLRSLRLGISVALVVGAVLGMWLVPVGKAAALTSSSFNAGDIIDNNIFTNSSTMSVTDIQNFLNAQVPTCDTNGTQASSHSNGSGGFYTHAQWGAVYDSANHTTVGAAPYVCLKSYVENPTSGQNNLQNPSAAITGGESAAQIIYNAAQAYTINPQVILTTLQKEQGLVTDNWPWTNEYTEAMGYNCTDSAPCSGFAGFYQQVNAAAKQFRNYLTNPNNFNYVVGSDKVAYSPSCAGPTITIQNQATAALYDYTPYQPDSSVLAATNPTGSSSGPGGSVAGDSCGAYGNRNFWWYFNTWFGPTTSLLNGITMTNITQPDPTPARGETVSYSYSLTNTFTVPITLDGVGLVGRLGSVSGANRDFGWQGPVTLQPNTTQVFNFTSNLTDTGTMYVWPAVLHQGTYVQYNNWGATLTIHPPNLTLSQPLITDATTVYAGQNVTFSATLKNNEPQPINYDAIGIPVRLNGSYSYDATWVGPGVIGAGQTVVLSGTRDIDTVGSYTYWVSDALGGTYTTIGSVKQFNALKVSPNFSVSGLSLTNPSPVQGQTQGTSFTVTNNLPVGIDVSAVGVVGRLGTFNGSNRDLGWQGPIHFNAGETKTFSGFSRAVTDVGTQYYWIGVLYNGSYIQYNNWGSTVVSHAPSFSVSGLSFTSTSPAVGQSLGATFTVTNNLQTPIDVDEVGVVGRLGTFNGSNRDLGWQGPIHFNAGETKTFNSIAGTVTEAGTHYYWIGILYNGSYLQYNNWGSTIVSH